MDKSSVSVRCKKDYIRLRVVLEYGRVGLELGSSSVKNRALWLE